MSAGRTRARVRPGLGNPRRLSADEGPASRTRLPSRARPAEKCPHRLEAVRRHEPTGDAVPECVCHLDRHPSGDGAQVGEKERPAIPQSLDDVGGGPEPRHLRRRTGTDRRQQPPEILPAEEPDGGCRGRCRPRPASRSNRSFGLSGAGRTALTSPKRQPPEADLSAAAQLVEEGALVSGHPCRQDGGLPGFDSSLHALELFDDLAEAARPDEAMAGSDVLPGDKEAHQLLGGESLDRSAGAVAHGGVDPHQQVTDAVPVGGIGSDATLQDRALADEPGEGGADLAAPTLTDAGPPGKLADGERTARLEIAADRSDERLLGGGCGGAVVGPVGG